jgi:hypothetical protein
MAQKWDEAPQKKKKKKKKMYMHNKCIVKIISQSSTTDYHIIFNYDDRGHILNFVICA